MSRTRWVVVALLGACLLGACDDSDPKPDIADPTPSATSSSPTVSTPPTISPTAPLGPDETVRAWVAAWNAALTSGDTASLSQYEAPDCRNCDGLAKVIDDVTAAGGSFTGGMWSIVNSKVIGMNDHRVKVNVAISVAAGSTVNAAGEDPVSFPADKRIAVYELDHSSATWLIDVIELLS